jgi:hypothetical protein
MLCYVWARCHYNKVDLRGLQEIEWLDIRRKTHTAHMIESGRIVFQPDPASCTQFEKSACDDLGCAKLM